MARTAIGDDRLAVLGEALQEALAGRRVRTAVFTTFTFDPGFFELHILANLFNRPFHQVEKIKRVQLEDALRSTESVCVYYDAEAIASDATPASLDFGRIALRRRTGCFHPKLILVLVEDHVEDEWGEEFQLDPPLALIVGTLSANLTRAGWWENVETGHFEELRDREVSNERCSFRRDLLALLRQVRALGGVDDDHRALDMVSEFVRARMTKRTLSRRTHAGRFYTRLFHGQQPLPEWLIGAGVARYGWNLEVISPFFDGGDAHVLRNLIEAIEPNETRVFLPCDHAGDALVTPAFRDSVAEVATWCDLPAGLQQRGGAKLKDEATTRRRVHAKVYRLWNTGGQEVILTGSVNLTTAAHSAAKSGNFEAAFLVDVSDMAGRRRWWLQPLDSEPTCADHVLDETGDAIPVYADIHLRYDWSRHAFEYRLDEPAGGAIEIRAVAGSTICRIPDPATEAWTALPSTAADEIRTLLVSTSFVEILHTKGSWRVLLREDGMHRRPSLLQDLSPEEILRYWSLLSDEQRTAFIEKRLDNAGTLEGLQVSYGRTPVMETIFDRVAGVFHAFERQYRRLITAIAKGETKEARATLFGSKYDSLPVLLGKIADSDDRDPVMAYLTHLSAQQLLSRIEEGHPDFVAECHGDRSHLDCCLARLDELRDAILRDDLDRCAFLDWYESMFSGVLDVEQAPA